MNYSEPLAGQIRVFLAFLGVGFLLGGIYEAFGFLRALFGGRRAAVVCDLLFWLFAFGGLFSACLGYTDGMWRLPELLAAVGGFLLFRRTAGRLLGPLLLRAAGALRALAAGLLRPVRAAATRLALLQSACARRLRRAVSACAQRLRTKRAGRAARGEKKWRKNEKNRKKALAKPHRIQYNDSR